MVPTATSVAVMCTALLTGTPGRAGAVQHTRGLEAGENTAEWTYRRTTYNGEEPYCPREWHLGYPDCGGANQSPIDLAADVEKFVKASEFDLELFMNECPTDELQFIANERVWEVVFNGCNDTPHLSFDGDLYNLWQIHVHSPSEHMIGGSLHDAEIHLVHIREGSDSDLLVVGILLDASDYGSNVEIQHLWDALDIGVEKTNDTTPTRVYDLLPANPVYSHYTGSLTTPPCTEGVKWIVMSEPVVMSRMQLDEFRTSVSIHESSKVDEFGGTNRPYQALNNRTVYFVR